jgi:hypothetical protein
MASAALIVDYSPNTTGAAVVFASLTNSVGQSQVLGVSFTLDEDAFITGGAIFSHYTYGPVGTPVRFLIYSDPNVAPIFDITTTVDDVDTDYTTSIADLTRKHATIDPIFLEAGTYWFAMPAAGNQNFVVGTGSFGDGISRLGFTPAALNQVRTTIGKPFFQLEGTIVPVPEPGTSALVGLGFCLVLWRGRRKSDR